MVIKPVIFERRPGTKKWEVPKSKGLLPYFPAGISDEEKRNIASEHAQVEEYILRADKVQDLLRTQLTKTVNDDYLCDIKDEITDYDGYALHQLYDHLFENYGKLGMAERQEIMDRFRTPPDLSKAINVYYAKQRECQVEMAGTRVPIIDEAMIDQLVTHFAESAIVNKLRQKWEHHIRTNPADDTWEGAKRWHRSELKNMGDAQKDTGMEKGAAFSAKKQSEIEEEVRQNLRSEMTEKMGDSLNMYHRHGRNQKTSSNRTVQQNHS